MRDRPTRLLALAVALLVGAALIAGLVSSRRAAQFESGTPEAAVQGYVTAALKGENTTAAGYFAADSECTVFDLVGAYAPTDSRVVLVDSVTTGATAAVSAKIIRGSGGGVFDGGEYAETVSYRLVLVGGRWLLTGTPWPLYSCGGAER